MAESSRRVVITGLGAVTPIGNTVSSYWAGLKSGANGVAPITLFDASRHACRFAAEVKEFDPSGVLDPKETKRWDRFCQFGVVAAKEDLAHSGLEITDANRQRIGVIIGSGVGGLLTMDPGPRAGRQGSGSGESVHRTDDDPEHGHGPGGDRARCSRSKFGCCHRLRRRFQRHW